MGGSGGVRGQDARVEKLILIVCVSFFLTLHYQHLSVHLVALSHRSCKIV